MLPQQRTRDKPQPSGLVPQDAKRLDWFFTQTVFARSTGGAVLDRLSMFSLQNCDLPTPGVDADGVTIEVNARPSKPHGDQTQAGGYVPTNDDMTWYAYISQRLGRLQSVHVGHPPVSVPVVFQTFVMQGGSFLEQGINSSCRMLCHLTASGIRVLAEVRAHAKAVIGRVQSQYKLTDLEAAFVATVDPDFTERARFAAARIGVDPEVAADWAAGALRKPHVRDAIKQRQEADRILGKTRHVKSIADDPSLFAHIAGRSGNNKQIKRLLSMADDEARELLADARRDWNKTRGK